MTRPSAVHASTAAFLQAQIHLGLGRTATPAEVALATLRQAARDVAACLEADPALKLTLPVPVGFLNDLLSLADAQPAAESFGRPE